MSHLPRLTHRYRIDKRTTTTSIWRVSRTDRNARESSCAAACCRTTKTAHHRYAVKRGCTRKTRPRRQPRQRRMNVASSPELQCQRQPPEHQRVDSRRPGPRTIDGAALLHGSLGVDPDLSGQRRTTILGNRHVRPQGRAEAVFLDGHSPTSVLRPPARCEAGVVRRPAPAIRANRPSS